MRKQIRNRILERGAALIEFALALPILLLFVAGILDIGSLFFQVQLASDAARYAGREIAHLSYNMPSMLCGDLKGKATTTVTSYMTNTLKISQQQWELIENSPTICKLDSSAITTPRIIIKFAIQLKDQSSCLFCYSNWFRQIRPTARMTYLLPNNCCVSGSPGPTCVEPVDCVP